MMIDRQEHPIGWSFLLDELSDAQEHLASLLQEMAENPEYSEEEFRIDLGHVFAHLNRAWYRRNVPEDFPDSDWDKATSFPTDLEPVA